MITIAIMMIGFGLFGGVLMYYVFKNKKPYKFQIFVFLGIVILALIINFSAFLAFGKIIKPLIPYNMYDGDYGWFVGLQAAGATLSILAIGIIIGSVLGLAKSKNFDQFIETAPVPKTALSSDEGRNSILKCPMCKVYLPIKWLVFSFQNTQHACKQCDTVLVWTKRRILIAAIAGASVVPMGWISMHLFDAIWPAFFIGVPTILFLATLIPGQYRIEE